MSTNFIINDDERALGFRPHPNGVCLLVMDKTDNLSIIHHIPLDLRDLTLLQAEIDDLIFELEGAEYETDPT
jgi:hypothetical protein